MNPDPRSRIAALDEASGSPRARQEILTALEDPTSLVREHAIALAARHLAPETLGELVRDEANATLRNSALSALERQGPYAVPHLTQLTQDEDLEVVMFSVQVLAQIKDPSTIAALMPLMEHPDLNIAQSAVEALGNVKARQAVPGLIRLLSADLWLQVAAVAALGEIADARAVPPLLELLHDEMLAVSVTEALAHIAAPEAVPALVEFLIDGDRLPLRDNCLRAIARTVEQHEVPIHAFDRLRSALQGQPGHEVAEFLRSLLVGDDRLLGRDAATCAVAAGLEQLYPTLLVRTVEPEETAWTAALCRRFSARLGGVMEKLCAHQDPHVRRGALIAGGLGPVARKTMLDRLEDPEPAVRAAACQALGMLADPSTILSILKHFGGTDSEEHHAAAEALGRMPPDSLKVLEPYLEVERGEASVLATLRVFEAARSAPPAVVSLTGAASASVRRAALRTMGADPSNPPGAFIKLLDDSDEAVRIEAVEMLVRANCRDAVPRLLACLGDEDLLRYHVIRGLGRLHATEASQPLLALFADALTHERIEIVNALIRIAPPGIMPFLRERLGEPEVAIRRVAVDGVARLGGPAEVSVLVELATDPDWNVRNHVAWGLGRIGDPAGRAALLELVRDVEPVVGRTARTALTKLSN